MIELNNQQIILLLAKIHILKIYISECKYNCVKKKNEQKRRNELTGRVVESKMSAAM